MFKIKLHSTPARVVPVVQHQNVEVKNETRKDRVLYIVVDIYSTVQSSRLFSGTVYYVLLHVQSKVLC